MRTPISYNPSVNQIRNNLLGVSGILQSEEEQWVTKIKESFYMNLNYTQVTKNSDTINKYDCIIYEGNKNEGNLGDQKQFLSYPYSESQFDVGDYIKFQYGESVETWLITSLDKNLYYNVFGTIQLCTQTLNLYQTGILYQIPCVVQSNINISQLDTEENKFISVPDSTIIVRISNNSTTQGITINQIYNLSGDNYKIVNINKVVENGIIVLGMEYVVEEAETHVFVLTILNGDSLQIAQSQSLTINAELKDNGVIVDSPTLLYSSSNTSIATINSSGIVTILNTGSVVFTVQKSDDASVKDTINVEIVAGETHNYTVEISSATSIVKGYTSNYSCVFKDNGNTIIEQSEFWLTGDDGVSVTTLAEITSQDSIVNTCVVNGLGLGYVKLWVKNVGETIVSQAFRIQIKNLF